MAANSSSSSSSDVDEDSIPLSQLFRFRKTPKDFKKNDIVFAKTSPYTWSPAHITNKNSNTASITLFDDARITHSLKLSQICDFECNFGHLARRVKSAEIDAALEELGQRAELGLMCSCRINPNVGPIGLASDFEPIEMVAFVRDTAVCAWVGADEIVKAVRLSAQVNGYQRYVSVCRTSGVDGEFCAGDLLGFLKNVAVCWCGDDWENAHVGDEVEQIGMYRRFVSLHLDWMYHRSLEIGDGSDSEEFEAPEDSDSNTHSNQYQSNRKLSPDGNEQDSWTVGEMGCGITCELEDDGVSTEIPKDDSEMYREQIQEGGEICVTNRADFCFLDLGEADKSEMSLMNNQLEPVPTSNLPPTKDNLINENNEMDNGCPSSSSQGSDINVEKACNRYLPCVTDTNKTAGNDTESLVNKERANHALERRRGMGRVLDIIFEIDESNVESMSTIDERSIQVTSTAFPPEHATCVGGDIPESPPQECQVHPSDEIAKFQSSPVNIVRSHNGRQNEVAGIISSSSQMEASEEPVVKKRRFEHGNTLPESALCLGGQLVRDLASESQVLPPSQSCKQYAAVSNGEDADQYESMEINSCSVFQTESAKRSVVNRRRWDIAASPNESNSQKRVALSLRKIEYSTCENRHPNYASDNILYHDGNDVVSNLNNEDPRGKENATRRSEGDDSFKAAPLCLNTPRHLSIGSLHGSRKRYHHYVSGLSDWCGFYASPLTKDETYSPNNPRKSHVSLPTRDARKLASRARKSCASSPLTKRDGRQSPYKARKSSLDDGVLKSFPKSLHMKFPRDFTLPSKQELEKKFGIFGPLDHSRTKVFTFTGAAQVVFLDRASSYAAYAYVKKRNVFGRGNVRFWVDEHEKYRKAGHVKSTTEDSFLDLKPCLKKPGRDKKEKNNVRFQIPAS